MAKGKYIRTPESLKKQSDSMKGKPSWNKGLTKETDVRVAKNAEHCLGRRRKTLPDGFKSWNNGLTKDIDSRCKGGPKTDQHSENNNAYVDGHTEKWKKWRLAILERDKFICQECGKPVEDRWRANNCHHLYSKEEFPELQYIVEDGACLHTSCHAGLHKLNESRSIVIPKLMLIEFQRIYNMCVGA